MTIYELLRRDHRHVDHLFKRIEKALDREDLSEVPELFDELKTELTAHSKAEQEVFYQPIKVLARTEEGKEYTWEGDEEHHVIRLLLNELSRLPFRSQEWAAKIKVLCEVVEHHVQEEESEIFNEGKKIFSDEEAEKIAESMESLKEIYKTQVDESLSEDLALLQKPIEHSSWADQP